MTNAELERIVDRLDAEHEKLKAESGAIRLRIQELFAEHDEKDERKHKEFEKELQLLRLDLQALQLNLIHKLDAIFEKLNEGKAATKEVKEEVKEKSKVRKELTSSQIIAASTVASSAIYIVGSIVVALIKK